MLYVPEGCAHGYLTLADDTEVTYFTSTFLRTRPRARRALRRSGVRHRVAGARARRLGPGPAVAGLLEGRTSMIIVDTALEERLQAGNPVRVAHGGRRLHGSRHRIADPDRHARHPAGGDREPRHVDKAERAYSEAGVDEVTHGSSAAELEQAIAAGRYAVTDDPAYCAGPGGSRPSSRRPATSSPVPALHSTRCATASTSS